MSLVRNPCATTTTILLLLILSCAGGPLSQPLLAAGVVPPVVVVPAVNGDEDTPAVDLELPPAPPQVRMPGKIPQLEKSRLKEVLLLVKELQRQKTQIRTRAERKLSTVGPAVIPHLIPVARSPFDLARISALRILLKTPHFDQAKVALEGLGADNRWVRKLSWQLIVKISGIEGRFEWDKQEAKGLRVRQAKRWNGWYREQLKLQRAYQEWQRLHSPDPLGFHPGR